jgi:hypothetical protein
VKASAAAWAVDTLFEGTCSKICGKMWQIAKEFCLHIYFSLAITRVKCLLTMSVECTPPLVAPGEFHAEQN